MLSKSQSYAHLDAARGLSAFIVVLAHMVQIFWLRIFGLESLPHQLSSIASHYAVVVFFVLSGFLITHSIELNINRHGAFRIVEYLSARIARIYPPFLICLALSALRVFELPGYATPLKFSTNEYSARDLLQLHSREIPIALSMLGGFLDLNGPLWSLYIEVKLYVLLACAYSLRSPVRVVASITITVALLGAGLRYNPEFTRYACLWLVGCMAYYIINQHLMHRKLKLVLSMSALLLAAIGGFWQAKMLDNVPETFLTQDICIELALAIAIAFSLFYIRVRLPLGQKMANYSYTLYVTHFPILLFFQALLIHNAGPSVAYTAIFSMIGCLVALTFAQWAGLIEGRKEAIQHYLMGWQKRVCTPRSIVNE